MSSGPNFLLFSADDADEIFGELSILQVELDSDPLAYGPKRLNGKVAECRKILHRAERIFLDVAQRLHAVSRTKMRAVTDIELAKKRLLAEDPQVRSGKSVADRDAEASMKLMSEIALLNDIELTELSLNQTMVVVKAKRADIKATISMLKDQMRLCQEEIGLGAQWGSKKKSPDFAPVDATADIKILEDMLGDVRGVIPLEEYAPEETPEEEEEKGSEDTTEAETVSEEIESAPEEPKLDALDTGVPEDIGETSSAEEVLPGDTPANLVDSFLDDLPDFTVFSDSSENADGGLDIESLLESFEATT